MHIVHAQQACDDVALSLSAPRYSSSPPRYLHLTPK